MPSCTSQTLRAHVASSIAYFRASGGHCSDGSPSSWLKRKRHDDAASSVPVMSRPSAANTRPLWSVDVLVPKMSMAK